MASGLANFGTRTWLSSVLGVVSPPAGYYVALCSDAPGPTSDGTVVALFEPSGGGYARQYYAAGSSNWVINNGYATNVNPISFPFPFTDWGRATHFALCDASSDGNLYAWGQFNNPQYIAAGYAMSIPPGGLLISLTPQLNSITT